MPPGRPLDSLRHASSACQLKINGGDIKAVQGDSGHARLKMVTALHVHNLTGVADIDADWDTYCKTLEPMGVQDMIEVYQAAYDRLNGK